MKMFHIRGIIEHLERMPSLYSLPTLELLLSDWGDFPPGFIPAQFIEYFCL